MRARGLSIALFAAIGAVLRPGPASARPVADGAAGTVRAFQQGLDTMRILRVDTFAHRRHTTVACPTCHQAHAASLLTFAPPRGCQSCHHRDPEANRCPACHTPNELAAPLARTVTVEVRDQPPRPRTVGFRHEWHVSRPCSTCHNQPVWLEPADSVLACSACHADHHQGGRTCGVCHNDAAAFAPHAPAAETHERCDRCHATRTIAGLVPDRSLCLTCHPSRQAHGAPRECTSCHFQQDPASYRRRLVTNHP